MVFVILSALVVASFQFIVILMSLLLIFACIHSSKSKYFVACGRVSTVDCEFMMVVIFYVI